MVSVIASSVRKGNVIEKDGKLYLVITAENIHPGKGTPVTHLEMRRISDGREDRRAAAHHRQHREGLRRAPELPVPVPGRRQYVFMQPETFDQLHVGGDVVGDMAPYLTENMDVQLQLFEGNAISIEIPQRATFEMVETEPVMKGQTASRLVQAGDAVQRRASTMVPTHIVDRHPHRGDDRETAPTSSARRTDAPTPRRASLALLRRNRTTTAMLGAADSGRAAWTGERRGWRSGRTDASRHVALRLEQGARRACHASTGRRGALKPGGTLYLVGQQ